MTATVLRVPGSAPLSRRRIWLLFTGLALALLLAELDQTIFATALPTVVGELDGVSDMLWVNTVYILTGTVTLPVYGHLSDRLGRKPLLMIGAVGTCVALVGVALIYSSGSNQALLLPMLIMHDGREARGGPRGQTVAAVGPLVDRLRTRGYRFTTVDRLLGVAPYA